MSPAEKRGIQALERLLQYPDITTVLDIGSGDETHTRMMRDAGKQVTTISLQPGADYVGEFTRWPASKVNFDAIWACHVLEHQVDPGAFLRECRRRLRPGGVLAVTVPPLKHAIVGGHVTLWNAGLLVYHLVLAGFDCSQARVGTYGYNISVIVTHEPAELPPLECDAGDVARLARFFPMPVTDGFDGLMQNVNWTPGEAPRASVAVAGSVPAHVAILGLGPSVETFLQVAKRMGGRSAYCDEVWSINAVADVIGSDRVFHMDDVRIQEIRAAAAPGSNIAAMLKWLKRHPGPVITSRAHPDYPGLVEFPLEAVINDVRHAYFNSTAAYAVAYAIHLGVKKMSLFGLDYTYANAHHAEAGRACVEFWLGMASARGIKLAIPHTSSLMDACNTSAERLYGYDTLDVQIDSHGDRVAVTFAEKQGPLPSAEEIEARYDHSKHPSPLIETVEETGG